MKVKFEIKSKPGSSYPLYTIFMEKNPDLRGTDYKDKEILEQNKMLELGYEPKLKI